MEPQFNRRSTDSPDNMERLVRMEETVNHVQTGIGELKTALAAHVKDETHEFRLVSENYQTIAISVSKLADANIRTTDAIEKLTTHGERINALEDFRERVEPLIEETRETKTKVEKIYWVVPLLWTVGLAMLTGFWNIGKHLGWF